MRQITTEQLSRLLVAQQSPCISLYQPTHQQHPENQQDPIRYRNLLEEMESSLRDEYPIRQVKMLLKNFHSLSHDHHFWNHRTDGLSIVCSPTTFEIFDLQRPVKELLVIADSFHLKPLLRILQSADRYQILCLNRHEAKLYEGNRDGIDPVELTNVATTVSDVSVDERSLPSQRVGTYGKRSGEGGTAAHHSHGPQTDPKEADMLRFFRAVDRGILEHHSRPSGLPLMLAALPESQERFRQVSQNPYLLPSGITMNPESLDREQLREQSWKEIEPFYINRLDELTERFHEARSRQSASGDLSDVAKAAVSGQVATLLVEADRIIHGTLDRSSGTIRSADLATSHVDDTLDDLAELVLAKGGHVVVVPAERMPTESGLAAIYRY